MLRVIVVNAAMLPSTILGSGNSIGLHMMRCLVTLLMLVCADVRASRGDQSLFFRKCKQRCHEVNCTGISDEAYGKSQPLPLLLTRWSCADECNYWCMWDTVDAFQRDHTPIPQFFGKWPFVRVLGIQEPASVIFSIANAVPHLVMLLKYRREVPSSAPLYWLWHAYCAICVNAWVWSAIFHTRDLPFTEMMDYFCAISLVLFSSCCLCARVLVSRPIWQPVGCFLAHLAYYVYHVYYLAFIHFDYGYNMKANIIAGIFNSVAWLIWSGKNRDRQPYVWKAAVTIVILNVLISLELADFPPLLWTLDAHSLWHLGTSPLPLLWYSFLIDDAWYLLEQKKEQDIEEQTMEEKKIT